MDNVEPRTAASGRPQTSSPEAGPSRSGENRTTPKRGVPRHLPPFLQVDPPPVPIASGPRLEALYASTSAQRESNPTGYKVNSSWWAVVITETLRNGWLGNTVGSSRGTQTPLKRVPGISGTATPKRGASVKTEDDEGTSGESGGDRLIMKVDERFLKRLANEDGTLPRGIGGVVEIQSTSSPPGWHPLSQFMSATTPLHAPSSMTYRFVGRPLWWILSQVNPFGSSGAIEKEEVLWKRYGKGREYVCMDLLEEAAANFTAYIVENPPLSHTSSLFTLTSFRDEYGEIIYPDNGNLPEGKHQLSIRDIEVLLRWLSRDCEDVVMDDKVIRVLQPDQLATDHPITEADRGAIDIIITLTKIDEQVDSIEKEIQRCQAKAKSYISNGQKTLAMSQLKSKKALEDVLDKRLGVAEQLRTVIRSIDQAKSDVEVMQVYETSNTTLRSILADPKLDRDHVTKTTDELADAVADQQEIEDAIRTGGAIATAPSTGDIDEDDLAAELEGLVKEEKERNEAERVEKERKEAVRLEKTKVEEKVRDQVNESERPEPSTSDSMDDVEELLQRKAKALGVVSKPPSASVPAQTEEGAEERQARMEWQKRYEDAQQRQREERQRAEDEQRRREAARVVAE